MFSDDLAVRVIDGGNVAPHPSIDSFSAECPYAGKYGRHFFCDRGPFFHPVHFRCFTSSLPCPYILRAKLLARRFKKVVMRYDYVLSERGLMMQAEPDIVDTKLDAAHRAAL